MARQDLTTLQRVKTWMGTAGSASDQALSMAITNISSRVLGYLERPSFVSRTYVEKFDGQGGDTAFLRNWPVSSMSSLTINRQDIPSTLLQAPGDSALAYRGWVLEEWSGFPPGKHQMIDLVGYCFTKGRQNCIASYTAGYLAEEAFLVTDGRVSTTQFYGVWIADNGVTKSDDGSVFSATTGVPAPGQYQLDLDPAGHGDYLFHADDEGLMVNVSYSYCPAVVEGIVWNLINEDYQLRSHAGQKSRSLASMESVTWDNSGMPPYAMMALQPYKNVLPL